MREEKEVWEVWKVQEALAVSFWGTGEGAGE